MKSSQVPVNRRRFLRTSLGASAALLTAPTAFSLLADPRRAAAISAGTGIADPSSAAFVDTYTTNTSADLTAAGNAAVRALGGFAKLWHTGDAWNTGTVLDHETLRANMRYCAAITRARTDEQAKDAFIHDRQHQSYGVIAGLGPLAPYYYTGAKAVTGITSAPDGTPAGLVDDAVPPGAPAGSAIGAGSPDSELGLVVQLVNTLRGPYASGNPSKLAYEYPRPWRMTRDSTVVDTGKVDALGFPVYASDVIVAPQLLRQRSTTPAADGGFPSGHTNAFYLAALALAYAVPERFQELVAHASYLSHTRIVAGMHSTVDVIGGRTLATALAAATLYDPRNASLKAAARAQAAAYFQTRTGSTADTLFVFAHSAAPGTDPYADRAANAARVTERSTYILRRRGQDVPLTVPKGAEVLLETRQPYLTADQRRAVLRSTALPAGHPLLDGYEEWGRLDLFAAADGYGRFKRDVRVTLTAADGGLAAADSWRNDIDGPGGLVKLGTGTLTLTGRNRYTGGTVVDGGTLVAASPYALGSGGVLLRRGTLRAAPAVRVRGTFTQAAGGTLEVALDHHRQAALEIDGQARLNGGTLLLSLDPSARPPHGATLPVLRARSLAGRFTAVTVSTPGLRAEPHYTRQGVFVRLSTR
ncbi:phosphatase PAP2 family protein [Actinoallomurus purpureus]|uniref:phosphatase PAP2 family protein n=1 Tax=Actinoallomurus purpureus TaxID=478114 RepID=UPI0020931A1F|nr:phosphatase PAP2 family protein [Actinoallomurus purpureus]MCO6011307.1 phosphatase PAP2 family protein [Actinoallomurus purpureus]